MLRQGYQTHLSPGVLFYSIHGAWLRAEWKALNYILLYTAASCWRCSVSHLFSHIHKILSQQERKTLHSTPDQVQYKEHKTGRGSFLEGTHPCLPLGNNWTTKNGGWSGSLEAHGLLEDPLRKVARWRQSQKTTELSSSLTQSTHSIKNYLP